MEPVVYTPVTAAANLRRSAIVGGRARRASIVVTAMYGHPLTGVFGCVGLALGALNNRMLQKSVVRYACQPGTRQEAVPPRCDGPARADHAARDRVGLLVRPDGLGVFVGLAVFQILMLIGAAVPVFRSLRPTS